MKKILFVILVSLAANCFAQKVSVYDSWEASPFRTGKLEGNIISQGDSVWSIQRSHYGSNLFGLRIDLPQTFRLSKQAQYVHIRVKRPIEGSRCMLITLGKRSERAGQKPETEENRVLNTTPMKRNQWYDLVFSISGLSSKDPSQKGVDIYSLVIIPDVASRSGEQDFMCQIGKDIEISNNSTPRTANK